MKEFKFTLKFLAIVDIIFAEKFVLTVYKNDLKISETKFCRKEINGVSRKGLF